MKLPEHPIIKTERLVLRPLRESDLSAFAAYRSNPEAARFQSWDVPYSLEQAKVLYRANNAAAFGTVGAWRQIALAVRSADALIGDLAVHFIDFRQIEIGFTISPDFQRKGYAKEAVSALLEHLFRKSNAHRVVATVDARNSAAAGLLVALGFRKEAHFHRNIFFKGEWGDELLFACLADEWGGKTNHVRS